MNLRAFVRKHQLFVVICVVLVVVSLALDGWMLQRRGRYAAERARLRAAMSEVERRHTDAVLASQQSRLSLMMQLIRRQANIDAEVHLAISVDSGALYLEREGALLRESPVEVGPERRIGLAPDTVLLAIPLGTRTVQRVVQGDEPWEMPEWVYVDRGLPVPAQRTVAGALGPVAIVLEGGTLIYSMPDRGPLNDSSYVLPGSIRASAEDLRALFPSVHAGSTVYFY